MWKMNIRRGNQGEWVPLITIWIYKCIKYMAYKYSNCQVMQYIEKLKNGGLYM